MNTDDDVPSPCISICRMDPGLGSPEERAQGGLCVGCWRTIGEIIAWAAAPEDGKRAVLAAINGRRAASIR